MKIVAQCIRLMVVGLAFVLLGSGCSGLGDSAAGRGGAPLRVGVSPVYRPVVFREDDRVVGIEADFARRAGERLGRRVEFIEMLRHDLIPALEVGTIDVIMSGMSITPDRARRVLFTTPYMRVGQLALIRSHDLARLGPPAALRAPGARIGYIRETTGQAFIAEELADADSYAFDTVDEGLRSLRGHRIDFFIHDAPSIWRVALDPEEESLMGLFRPLTEEYLAWAVRRTDTALKADLDALLDDWKARGDIDRMVNRWMPLRVNITP